MGSPLSQKQCTPYKVNPSIGPWTPHPSRLGCINYSSLVSSPISFPSPMHMLGLAQDFKKANLLTLSLSQVSTLYFSIPSLQHSYNTLPTWIPANVIIKVTNNLQVAKLKGLFLVLILLLHLTLRTPPPIPGNSVPACAAILTRFSSCISDHLSPS